MECKDPGISVMNVPVAEKSRNLYWKGAWKGQVMSKEKKRGGKIVAKVVM